MRVLLPIDGSPNALVAASALPHLGRLEEVLLLHALDLPSLAYPMGRPEVDLAIPAQVERALREDGEAFLARAAAALPAGVGAVEKRLETGSAPAVIVDVAERENVDLVLLAARGLSGLEEVLLGSVSHAVVAHATCPVLVVRDAVRGLRRALVAVQDAEDAASALHFLRKAPFREPPEVTLLHVLPLHPPRWPIHLPGAEAHRDAVAARAREFLNDALRELVHARIPATSKLLLGRPATTILEELEAGGHELVVVGTHRKSAARRLLLGSVSGAVVHRTRRPVLVLR